MRRLEGNSRTAAMLVGIVLTMGALSWAAVPFYSWFCKVTGYGGTPGRETVEEQHKAAPGARVIKVRFDANVNHKLPWKFHPVQREIETKVRGGKLSGRVLKVRMTLTAEGTDLNHSVDGEIELP